MKLVIINGLPATGKSTIAKPLSDKLNMPIVAKDAIKEFLFDQIGVKDREWSRALGRLSNVFLYEITETALAAERSIIIENAFETVFAKPQLLEIANKYNPEILEIYCYTDASIRKQRFIERNESGARHKGHADHENYLDLSNPEAYEKYAALEIGHIIRLETTSQVNIDNLSLKVKSDLDLI